MDSNTTIFFAFAIIFFGLMYFYYGLSEDQKPKIRFVQTTILAIALMMLVGGLGYLLGERKGHIRVYEDDVRYEQIIYYNEEGEPVKTKYKFIKNN